MSKVKTAEEFYEEFLKDSAEYPPSYTDVMRAYASHVLEVAAERAKGASSWISEDDFSCENFVENSILDIKKEL